MKRLNVKFSPDPDPNIDQSRSTHGKKIYVQVGELMTAILGPDGGGGSLEDTITLVLVKKVNFCIFQLKSSS